MQLWFVDIGSFADLWQTNRSPLFLLVTKLWPVRTRLPTVLVRSVSTFLIDTNNDDASMRQTDTTERTTLSH